MISNKVFPDVVICTIFIDALCREGRMEEAEHMLVTSMKQIDVQPNISTYTALMNGYCLLGKMAKARNIFQLAVKSGIKHNVRSYTSLMNGNCKLGQVNEVYRLFTLIRRKGLECNVVSYNIMLEALFCEGRCEEGLKLLEEMEALQVYPTVLTYAILLCGLCSAHRIERTMVNSDGKRMCLTSDVFDELPSKNLYVVTCTILVGAICEEGRIEEAKDLMMQMVNNGCLPNGCLPKSNKMDDAILVLKEMIARGGCTLGATTISMLSEPLRREGNESVLFDMVMKLLPKKVQANLV